ncbi:hypothetical protein, partial [Salmonella sp. s51228]|uniref:hypothetical protein n=1 Tax=Salmonella sp. s51228 TaxID=3159652 RepID=UPI00397F08D4
ASSKPNEADLFELSNAYFIGNYQQCINCALKMTSCSPEVARDRDIFMYRAYIAQGKYKTALEEILDKGDDVTLASVRLMAEYLTSTSGETKSKVMSRVDSLILSGSTNTEADSSLVVLSGIYLHEHNTDACIRTLNTCNSLEA